MSKHKPDFPDLDKDGNKKEPMKAAAKTAKMKAHKKPFAKSKPEEKQKKGKKKPNKKEQMNENTLISSFINCVLEKKYSEADKYLTDILTSKMQQRIEGELSTPLF
jgi:hypothetical protein